MINNSWYDCFIEALYKKCPQKSQLTEALTDLLLIERESVYRRLRKNVMFSSEELVKIASAWDISLDEIIKNDAKKISFKIQLLNYIDPSDEELKDMQILIENLHYLKIFPDVEYMEVSNVLPCAFVSGFSCLIRYHLLKWRYQYANEETLPFSQIFPPQKLSEFSLDYHTAIKNLANTSFIWDQMLFNSLVHDIHYFCSIYLITNEEKELIKKDLYFLLNYMSEMAAKGCWPETGNKVNLYISHINIDTNYSYYYSEALKVCRVHAFAKNEIYTNDPIMIENFRNWMQFKKRSSVLISEADEKSRIGFLMKQRGLIDTL